MSMTFKEITDEVKRRATRNQGGSNFDVASDTLVNGSLTMIANEAHWRALRRKEKFSTVGENTTGTVTTVKDSTTWTLSSLNPLTAGIDVGRRVKITGTSSGSSKLFEIESMTATTLVTTEAYDVTGASGLSFKIMGQEVYNLPIQTSKVGMIWHEEFGYPFRLRYITDIEFFQRQLDFDNSDTPELYRMWGEDWVIDQPRAASVLTVSSSSSADQAKKITVFGTVSGYPDREEIITNASDGTTAVAGLKSFSKVERISKEASLTGRVTVTADSANTTVAVLPTGNTTAGILYKKISVYPPPTTANVFTVQFYKEPYRLTEDSDIHELGGDFDELLIELSVSKLQADQSKKDADTFFAYYSNQLKILRRKNADKLDYLPTRQRPYSTSKSFSGQHRYLGFNQLGSKYGPSGRF